MPGPAVRGTRVAAGGGEDWVAAEVGASALGGAVRLDGDLWIEPSGDAALRPLDDVGLAGRLPGAGSFRIRGFVPADAGGWADRLERAPRARRGGAVIELRGVVAIAGAAPLSLAVRRGEVVRLDGPAPVVSAVLDVIAGRRAPRAGEVVRRDAVPLVVRAGERMPAGVEASAVALWAALAGLGGRGASAVAAGVGDGDGARGDGAAAARGGAIAAPVWLIDGALDDDGAAAVAGRRRGGAGRRRGAGVDGGARPRPQRPRRHRRRRRAVGAAGGARGAARARARRRGPRDRALRGGVGRRHAGAGAGRADRGVGRAGRGGGRRPRGLLVSDRRRGVAASADLVRRRRHGAVAAAATWSATRAAAARAWPAMLRETGAPPRLRAAALVAGDVAAVALAAAVASVPAVWAWRLAAALAAAVAIVPALVVAAAIVAAGVTWAARRRAAARSVPSSRSGRRSRWCANVAPCSSRG
ncbi:MAG: hypothetical protein H6708_01725 [Kofleriaceae bacterium]|nr:hypothetical protein [Kofleriaceae bacterium]